MSKRQERRPYQGDVEIFDFAGAIPNKAKAKNKTKCAMWKGCKPAITTKGERKMAPKSNKKITGKIKLQIEAGKANPSPPVGPALGQKGVNIMDFCKQFNERTASQAGYIIPVVIDVYEDRSFDFVIKSPPAAVLIKKELNLPKGSAVPNKNKVGQITQEQLEKIAKIKIHCKAYSS